MKNGDTRKYKKAFYEYTGYLLVGAISVGFSQKAELLLYFKKFPAPTAETLFLLVLSILALESVHSIRFLYTHFLSGITEKSLNAFYYVCSYARVNYSSFMNITTSIALKLIPNFLRSQPVFLCIDDTMMAKFRKNLRMFQNFLTMLLTMIPITLTDTVLLVLCSVFLYGGNSKLFICQFL